MLECQGCHRYVRATESSCPFCAAPVVLTSAASVARGPMVAFAAGLSLLACTDSNDEAGESNAVTTDPSTSESTSSSGESDSTSTSETSTSETTTLGDGDGDTQETFDYTGADYGGSPPCDELADAIPLNLGSNPVDTTMSGNAFNTYCDGQMGTGPDEMLSFIAPADGQFTFAITGANFDAWLLESGYYCDTYSLCSLNQALDIALVDGETLYLILDSSTVGGGTASIDVTQG